MMVSRPGGGAACGTAIPAPPRAAAPGHAAALEEYVQAQRYTSDLPSGSYNLGNLEVALGRPAEAERHYRRAFAIDDQLFPAKAYLGMLLAGQGRLNEAESLLRQARAARPGHASLAFNLGLLLAERGKRDEAEQALRVALEANPHLAAAADNLAVMVGEARPNDAAALGRPARRPGDTRAARSRSPGVRRRLRVAGRGPCAAGTDRRGGGVAPASTGALTLRWIRPAATVDF